MSIRTLENLSDALAGDLIWRKRELSSLKLAAERAAEGSDARHALARAMLALLYAHWEGYIKRVAESYLQYVHFQRLQNRELAAPFLARSGRSVLRSAEATDKIRPHIATVQFFLTQMNQVADVQYKNAVRTNSNLSSRVLREILESLGLDYSQFSTRENLIDEILLDTRNTIAHGEFVKVDYDRYQEIHDHVLEMLELIRGMVEDACAEAAFKAS